jgi:hypothetical protein
VHRTQLYIDDDLYRALVAAADAEERTLSEVLRDRLRRALATPSASDAASAIDAATGLWAGRDDLPPTHAYVRTLRSGQRRRRA